jgi:hypothetical protein
MPPLEKAPGSYFADIGSAEHDELVSRAINGEFSIWSVHSVSGRSDNSQIFIPLGEEPNVAGSSFVFDQAQEPVNFTKVFPRSNRESQVSTTEKTRPMRRMGKLIFARSKKI